MSHYEKNAWGGFNSNRGVFSGKTVELTEAQIRKGKARAEIEKRQEQMALKRELADLYAG